MVKPPINEAEWPEAAQAALRAGRKIDAIKILRETYNLGLKDAKDMVDTAHLPANKGTTSPRPIKSNSRTHYAIPLILLFSAAGMIWQANAFISDKSTDSYCLRAKKGTFLICSLLPKWAEAMWGPGNGYLGAALMLYLLAALILYLTWLSYNKLSSSSS